MKNQLNSLRKQIDILDNNLLKILAKRFQMVKKIGQLKKKLNLSTFDKKRFDDVLKTRISKAQQLGLSNDLIKKIYNIIHEEALEIEKSV